MLEIVIEQARRGVGDLLGYDNTASKPTWDIDHTPNAAVWPGVFEYLRHRREWISAKGNLVKRK